MNNKMAINIYLSTIESKKQNKLAEQKQNQREKVLMVARWEGAWGDG